MRQAEVHRNHELIGYLTEHGRKLYIFKYDQPWFDNSTKPAVSLTMPKNQQEYRSEFLFPFFFSMLSEGANRRLQCTHLHIDEEDNFGLLLAVAQFETIGAISVKPVK